MKKKIIFFIVLLISVFFNHKDTYAFSSSDYVNRSTCGNFEVAGFHSDGEIVTVSCHNTFEEAKDAMQKNGADDLAVLNRYGNTTRILDANVALLDLTMLGSNTTFNIYTNSELTGDAFTYMVGAYGAVDGVLLDTAYSNHQNVFVAKVKIGNYVGWIRQNTYEIVPITWVKSSSSYTITDEIRHNYVTKITDSYSGESGRTIGPKPDMLAKGTYYSYDGHYFYTNLTTMIKDYKAGHYNNSVNKDKPYYNYYQYLSNHTRTNYSSINIDEYIRNNLGYVKDVFGNDNMNKAEHKSSKLYGKGAFFYYAQENYGANAALTLALARNESGNGTSNISINRNNGFGMNAVDSNPYEGSTWFPTFMSSIYEFAQYYVTYGYLDPNDWRYYGPQFGNKGIGMNVKYASDVYWSEKMASNYYYMDKAFGMQDYNYYQLGIINSPVYARSNTNTSSKAVYYYRKAESGVVILDEVEGQVVNGNNKWYKIVSDMNIDSNFNEIKSGNYNWNSYVYVPAAYVTKINNGKNGYISPNEVTEYQDKGYAYDLFVENATFKPKVAKSVKETTYYYDPTLLSKKGQKLLTDKYVMVFAAAYDENNNIKSYLVTSDYWYDQKHWVSADSIKFTSSRYGQASVTVPNTNAYTWINYNKVDAEYSKIGGLYTYAYIPIVGEEKDENGTLWYKVPYDLSGTSYEYGYTLASFANVEIKTYEYKASNTPPVITAKDREIIQGKDYDDLAGVSATDQEDGNLTSSIKVINNTVDKNIPGVYEITYKVVDKNNEEVTKTIKVTVIKDEAPVITSSQITTTIGKEKPNLLSNVTATDKEDGNITKDITVDDSKVNYNEVGEYTIFYKVKDSFGNETTKEEALIVKENTPPVIYASDKTITIGSTFEPSSGVKAQDEEDGDITKNIKVINNTVNEKELGTYEVTYQVTDNHNNTVEKTIKVTVTNKQEKEGTFYFDYLDEIDNKLNLRGYLTINGIDNTLEEEISYKVIFTSTTDKNKIYEQEATRITDLTGINRPIYSVDGKKYTHAWFEISINIDNLPLGNYTMEVQAESKEYYSKALVTNKLYKTEITSHKADTKNVNIKNNYSNRTSAVTLYVREKETPTKTSGSYYNQYDVWRVFEFIDNKLHLKGATYSYGMDLSSEKDVSRTMIFENKENFKTYKFDIGSITNGLYKVALPVTDNLDKTRAWYDATIDIAKLPKGIYKIYMTTTSNITDYSEYTDNLGRDLTSKKISIDGKLYQFKLNKEDGNSIELEVA